MMAHLLGVSELTEMVPPIWRDEFGQRRPVRRCPRCRSDIPVFRLRVEGVHRDGWCIFLTGLALVVFLNGQMDRSSVTEIHTKVAGKFIARGRFSMRYHLNVASWRRAGREEDLRVNRHVYDRADSGDDISIQLHRGWFDLSWYGQVVLFRQRPIRSSSR
jgi:hypothetical protein